MYAALSDLDARNDLTRNSGGSFMPPRESSYGKFFSFLFRFSLTSAHGRVPLRRHLCHVLALLLFFFLTKFIKFTEGRRSQRGSQHRSRDNSGNRMMSAGSRSLQSMPRQQQQQQPHLPYIATSQTIVKPETINEPEPTEKAIEQIQNSLCTIVEEYFSGQPKEEFTDELKKLVKGAMRPIAVRDLFNLMLEKSKKHRLASGEIIVHMFVNEIIRVVDYEAGLQQVLDGADDISIDVPKIWDYLAELAAPALIAKIINFESLVKCGTGLISKGHGKKFLSSIIKFIDAEFGPQVVRDLWGTESFTHFMETTDVEEFVNKNVSFDAINGCFYD